MAKKNPYTIRRTLLAILAIIGFSAVILTTEDNYQPTTSQSIAAGDGELALKVLEQLEVRDQATKTTYSREEFGSGWGEIDGCDSRNVILKRDLIDTKLDGCLVTSGTLLDPYTGRTIYFERGANSSDVQIDHVVALSDAWQKGASDFSDDVRLQLANDPLNLLAVDGQANQQKSDADAAKWLPPAKAFRCQYVARQISVKQRYKLWLSGSEKEAIAKVLATCPDQTVF
jgi:hypothetical protein